MLHDDWRRACAHGIAGLDLSIQYFAYQDVFLDLRNAARHATIGRY
jgi:hypothetical protein